MSVAPFPPETEFSTVSHEELKRAMAAGACTLVDVREPNEYEAGHIPGALSLPLSAFDPAALPAGKPVVLVCQAGGRSARALQAARAAGLRDIRHYAPGTGGWRALGEPVES